MKKNYNNNSNNKKFSKENERRGTQKRGNGNNNANGNKKHFESRKPLNEGEKKLNFAKNIGGFLVVSLFIKNGTELNVVSNSIESALAIEHKKKVVVIFENPKSSLVSSIRKKFESAFGIFFYTPKAKLTESSSINASIAHTEVLHSFKSNFFLTLEGTTIIRQFSVEKMLSFLCKPGDVLAVSPKFYDYASKNIIQHCRRFFSFFNILFGLNEENAKKHFMMERGEVGYYSIHRIDYGSLECMLFVTEALTKVKSFPKFKNIDLRNSVLCKKFSKKTKGKIMFYPHSRVSSSIKDEEKPSFIEKLKYIFS